MLKPFKIKSIKNNLSLKYINIIIIKTNLLKKVNTAINKNKLKKWIKKKQKIIKNKKPKTTNKKIKNEKIIKNYKIK